MASHFPPILGGKLECLICGHSVQKRTGKNPPNVPQFTSPYLANFSASMLPGRASYKETTASDPLRKFLLIAELVIMQSFVGACYTNGQVLADLVRRQ